MMRSSSSKQLCLAKRALVGTPQVAKGSTKFGVKPQVDCLGAQREER